MQPEESERQTVRGTLQLQVNRNPKFPDNCRGFDEEGYGDIHVGQQVVIADGAGATVATGELTRCQFSPLESAEQARGLRFAFVVRDVPQADFYSIRVGSGSRGEVTYSLDDLSAADWRVALNL